MNEIEIKIIDLIENKKWSVLKKELQTLEPILIAEIIENVSREEAIIIFRLLSRELAKETFQELSYDDQEDIISGLANHKHKLVSLLNDLEPDDRTEFFEELPSTVCKELMQLLSNEERAIAENLLGYPEDSIGRLMTTEYVAVKPYFTVKETLEHIRKYGRDSETLNVIYVVDANWKLIDDIRIKEILLADPEKHISEITDNKFTFLNANDDKESAVNIFQDYDRVALPVLHEDGTLLGIVTIDDVMDVVEEESTEDFQKFGGTEGLDLSYTKTSLFEMIKKRSTWLIILFVSEMLTASAMGYFDAEISKAVVLALFVPLIISSGGNSGSQAASLIIRSLAIRELKLSDWWYVMRKEIFSGLLLGMILGIIGFIRILIWQKTGLYNYGEFWVWIGLSVSISLILIVMWGTLMGSMIPIILKRIGLDPATASAPFVATLVDVTGLIIYFSIAAMFLSGKLL